LKIWFELFFYKRVGFSSAKNKKQETRKRKREQRKERREIHFGKSKSF